MKSNQGKYIQEEVKRHILGLATKDGFVSYTRIMSLEGKNEKGKYAKETILKALHALIRGKFMEKKRGDEDDQFRPKYCITAKGWELLWRYGTDQIICGLKNILFLGNVQPEQLEMWRQATRNAVFHAKTPQERIKIGIEMYQEHYGLLARAYKVIHNLVVELVSPEMRNEPVYIGITKDGDLHRIPKKMIPKDLLP